MEPRQRLASPRTPLLHRANVMSTRPPIGVEIETSGPVFVARARLSASKRSFIQRALLAVIAMSCEPFAIEVLRFGLLEPLGLAFHPNHTSSPRSCCFAAVM